MIIVNNKQKLLFLLLFAVFLITMSSCGWFSAGNEHPTEPIVLAPELIETEDGTFVYIPPNVDVNLTSINNDALECEKARIIEKEIPAISVNDYSITFVYKTVNKEYVFELDREDEDDAFLINSDYVHVKSAKLFVKSGDDLGFIEWIKSHIGGWNGPPVVWSPSLRGRESDLRFDGSVNIRDYIKRRDGGYYFTNIANFISNLF